MAKHPGNTSHNTSHNDRAFSELSKADQRRRAETARKAASENVFKSKTGSPEAKKHFKAEQAANRVLGRLGPAPERADATNPGTSETKAQKGRRRRKPISDATTRKTQEGLDAVRKLAEAGR